MKIIKVILLLFLVLKSSGGIAISFSCCDSNSEPTETIVSTDNDHDDSDDKDCCGGSNCDCLCCSHIFTMEDTYELSVLPSTFPNIINAAYTNRLSRIYNNSLWQPPQYS